MDHSDLTYMENSPLNEKSLPFFVIVAETLEGWKSPASEEGKAVLMAHYAWGAALKANGKLVLAGPTDFEWTSTGKIDPIGHTTGLIVLRVGSREEAEEWAFKEPFHLHGFRRNRVYSLKITMTEDSLFGPLEKLS
jgi:uncharacterized protein YciI